MSYGSSAAAGKRWTPEEEGAFLQSLRSGQSVEAIASRHGRTVNGMNARLDAMAMKLHTQNVPLATIVRDMPGMTEARLRDAITRKAQGGGQAFGGGGGSYGGSGGGYGGSGRTGYQSSSSAASTYQPRPPDRTASTFSDEPWTPGIVPPSVPAGGSGHRSYGGGGTDSTQLQQQILEEVQALRKEVAELRAALTVEVEESP